MRYLSVCSGIEAATQAWHPLGWQPVAFSEIERFPSAVLAHHYPHVPNWGDMTRYEGWPDADVDVLCGGTPCQSFSIAGLRKGLADPRGNLMLTFGAIAGRYRPRWMVWENVPGVLSSNGGRDFGAFLGMLGELGYGFAYRILDAQHVRTRRFPHAVPQRRRRVWVVAYLGDWRRAAAVLFDRESLSGHPPPRREAGQGFARGVEFGPQGGGFADVNPTLDTRAKDGPIRNQLAGAVMCANSGDVGYCLTASAQQSLDAETETLVAVAHALRGEGFDASEDGTGRGTPIVPVAYRTAGDGDSHQPLQVLFNKGVRLLTERENTSADASEAGPGEALRALRVAVGEEAFSEWCAGISAVLQSPEVLRSEVHGGGLRRSPVSNTGVVNDALPRPEGDPSWAMREMRGRERQGCPPHRPRSHEQRPIKSDEDMPELPRSGASAEAVLCCLRRSDEGARLLQQASDTLAKVWRPVGYEDPASEDMHNLWCSSALEVALREALHAGEASGDATSLLTDRSGDASGKGGCGVGAVRRLTPRLRECERLMGFPDDFTRIPWGARKKIEAHELLYIRLTNPGLSMDEARALAADGPRYKALGNSWAVNCADWIGERIAIVDTWGGHAVEQRGAA